MEESTSTFDTRTGNNNDSQLDSELVIIDKLMKLLGDLSGPVRNRVLTYALQRLEMTTPAFGGDESKRAELMQSSDRLHSPERHSSGSAKVQDIRSFSEEKVPKSASERAAVVAYFLSEMALANDRKDSINQEDITKYFKQAKFPLPSSPAMTLVHAKNAGYFEAEAPGQYRLNAVGYNLVAHRLPQEGEKSIKRIKSRRSTTRGSSKPDRPTKKPTKRAR